MSGDSTNKTAEMLSLLRYSLLMHDYKRTNILPPVDTLLDWRLRLVEFKAEEPSYPQIWFDREIAAADYLLAKHRGL